jgi:hypothetical protein
MNGQMDDLRLGLLCHRQRSWQDSTPQSPTKKLLSHVRQCWAEFCDYSSVSDPVIGFKNYFQHEVGFLECLKGRDSCDETSLGCYQRFFRHLAEEDLGGAPDEGLASPLEQLLRDLQAAEETTRVSVLEQQVYRWTIAWRLESLNRAKNTWR